MSSHNSQPAPPTDDGNSRLNSRSMEQERFEESYRAVSKAAVVAMILAILGLLGIRFLPALAFSLVGIIFGWIARGNLIRYPEELTGKGIAQIGILLSCLGFFGGIGLHTYEYITEVPDGYGRVGFFQLQPDPRNTNDPIPSFVFDLVNKNEGAAPIFIKGYSTTCR